MAEPSRSRLRVGDAASEALAGLVQRPSRTALTVLGTVLGIGAFVAILGITSTAAGQVGQRFNALANTTVTAADTGLQVSDKSPKPGRTDFPDTADADARRINGVVSGGVYWDVHVSTPSITSSPAHLPSDGDALPVTAVTPGLFAAAEARVRGAPITTFENDTRQHVAVLGKAAAATLGIHQLTAAPAVFLNGDPYTVVGLLDDAPALPSLLLSVLIPAQTAQTRFPPPNPETSPATMLVRTRVGAAQVVAAQLAVALRPDRPDAFTVSAPPDPHTLKNAVNTDLAGLFLSLAAVALLIGGVGIANTTLVAVIERRSEIGLKRALGARQVHIAAQFLTESVVLGAFGGLIGAALGTSAVIAVALVKHWTALLAPWVVLSAPLAGAGVGLLAGSYPAIRAARTEPVEALQR